MKSVIIVALALALGACTNPVASGFGFGSVIGIEAGSPPTEVEAALLGKFNEDLARFKQEATALILEQGADAREIKLLTDAEDKAEAAVAALRRDPRDSFERNSAAAALKRFEDAIASVRAE